MTAQDRVKEFEFQTRVENAGPPAEKPVTGDTIVVGSLPRPGFFERQFSLAPTYGQTKFDWYFGVALPIVCIAADPVVFRSGGFFTPVLENGGRALLGDYKIFCYALSSLSIMAMAAWLLWGQKLGELRPFLAGLFLVAGAISTLVGLVLFPFSLIGSIVLIGLLGFTPLFSGFVFLRNAVRAIDGATDDLPKAYVFRAVTLAALYALIVPFVLNF
jgi:hypothetical protein